MSTIDTRLQAALARRFGETLPIPPELAGQEALLGIAAQTSHRRWADRPVTPALTRLLAACALSAPTKSFLQQADIIDVRDPARRAALAALTPAMPWLADAPALLVFCANGRRFKRLFDRQGLPFANDHLDAFFNSVVDASLVMMNFIRAADSAGLVSCAISQLRNQAAALATILELPPRVIPVAGLCLGYPTPEALAQPSLQPRLPLPTTFHVDGMGSVDDDAGIDDFDRRYLQSRAAASASANQARTWSAERTHQYTSAQRADWGGFVRSQGFDLD